MRCAVRTTDLRRLAVIAVVAIAGCGAPAASGPPASPRISCVGVPAAKCDEAVASVARSLPNTVAVSIEVSCVSGTCTPESGAMDTVVTLADGSQLRSSTLSWSEPGAGTGGGTLGTAAPVPAPVPAPVVPVEPTCQGVPVSMCKTMAETAFGEISDQAVIAILVRCSEPPCTDRHGTGDTVVSYADGTTRTSSWEYAGS
jgi:hypothetical protein